MFRKRLIFASIFLCSLFFLPAQEADFSDGQGITADGVDLSLQRELSVAMSAQKFNLNPHTANYSSEAQILDALYEGLYSYDPKTLAPRPALAEEFRLSRDKKKITYTIRHGAKFSDGSDINAFSVRSSWLMLLSTPGAPYASLLDCIEGAFEFRGGKIPEEDVGITARDDRTLVVRLVKPTSHFNKILCHHAFSVRTGADNVFSGAFVLKERTDDSILLEKNRNYWDADSVRLPSIRIHTSDEITENSWNFNVGRTDWICSVFDSSKILNKNSVRISAIFGTEYVFFTCKNSPWDRPDFRNALVSAVPWNALRSNTFMRAATLVYPLAGYPSVEGLEETSPEDALEMMRKARKDSGIGEETLKIRFGISATSERQMRFFEILRDAWKPLGVEVVCEVASDYRYIEAMPSWDADLFVYSWIGDFADPLAFLELFRENSTLNQSRWKNGRYEELLDGASVAQDDAEHYRLLSQAEQTLLDDGVVLPVGHSVSLHAINLNSVGGWYTNALDIHPYRYLYFKETPSDIPNVVMR